MSQDPTPTTGRTTDPQGPQHCLAFRESLHFRTELRGDERQFFEQHLQFCVTCERLLLETDAPEQSMPGRPSPTPADLVQIAIAVAECLGDDPTAVLDRTGTNARALFRVRDDGVAVG